MRKLVIGILAHVDAGKTTLSESLLYLSGKTAKLGRVDNRDAYLDTHDLERERGITIFSKQAVLELGDTQITLLDTPGHVDFSAEMERTLQVLDYAILVISGADGVQGHTHTLWRLLSMYKVPVFLFVNKMDQPGTDKGRLLAELRARFDDGCVNFGLKGQCFFEQLALRDEILLETFLETETIETRDIQQAILERKIFPCYFGSALKLEGVEPFMKGIQTYTRTPSYPSEFGAKVFKISRDEENTRLTHLKLTGGGLKVRGTVTNGEWEEKVNQIRIYSGEKFETVDSVEAGAICAVTGLSETVPGEGLGNQSGSKPPILEPVLSYRLLLPEGIDAAVMLPKLRELEEEDPELRIVWNEDLQEIQAQIMGEVQIEILQSLILRRFNVEVLFDTGKILYKETITNIVEGVGHFEPLRHYAEVHLILEPGEPGSGLEFSLNCSEDVLAKNWQRLILSHLREKTHKGVLTGSPMTDMKITVVSGRAHNAHTDGGDFREATFRAVRQGLKEADSVLLEPYYSFLLEVPEKMVGRAMTDIERMQGTWEIGENSGDRAVLTGSAPVVTMRNYHREVAAYTKGLGRLSLNLAGYKPCHNAEEVMAKVGYDSERDAENPTGSIFISQGTGFFVPWDKVKDHMHVESSLKTKSLVHDDILLPPRHSGYTDFDDSDMRYLNTTANQGKKSGWNRREVYQEREEPRSIYVPREEPKAEYLLVDGYNVIYAWPELKKLAESHLDVARMRLLDILSSYQGVRNCQVIVVFDAYGVVGHLEEVVDYHNIHVVYTKEAQTADEYIEKFAHDNKTRFNVTVATSDALQQIIIRGAGSLLLSARELKEEIETAEASARRSFEKSQPLRRSNLEEVVSPEVKKQMEDL